MNLLISLLLALVQCMVFMFDNCPGSDEHGQLFQLFSAIVLSMM